MEVAEVAMAAADYQTDDYSIDDMAVPRVMVRELGSPSPNKET